MVLALLEDYSEITVDNSEGNIPLFHKMFIILVSESCCGRQRESMAIVVCRRVCLAAAAYQWKLGN